MSRRSNSDGGTADSGTTTLGAKLRARLRLEGAITFREWMSAALYDEQDGYYQRGVERWGRAGDYRTSPERSALFAATFARHFASLFDELGRPPVLHLLEAGGGAGHFAQDFLSTLRRDAPRVFDSTRYVFDEASADSRARAAALLAPFDACVEFQHLVDLDQRGDCAQREDSSELQSRAGREGFVLPYEYAFAFSNELLDAFPGHRVVMRGGSLRELFVGLGAGGEFVWIEREPSTPRLAEHFGRMGLKLDEGQFAEVNLDAEEWVARVARMFVRGYVVTVDYGDAAVNLLSAPHRSAGTLRAFRGHEFVDDVLRRPGEQDLTTTVNWTQIILAGEAAGLQTVALTRLDAFLLQAGLLEQLERECALASNEAEVAGLRLGAREMILPGGMASRFQVLVQKKV
ncbi:MAG TPA: SAM-dependent methyltransferase [Pyrinomonadaceae bacterium]|jgi:SAM-dependent MidA family methyltransferase|nr:SAM-dependent methyltransferase [Pyrinomonadaceae bacterium]